MTQTKYAFGACSTGFLSKGKMILFWPKAPDLIRAPGAQGKAQPRAVDFQVKSNLIVLSCSMVEDFGSSGVSHDVN